MAGGVTESSPKLRFVIQEMAEAVSIVDWDRWLGIEGRACIPISVFGAEFLMAKGVVSDARPVEAGVVITDPASPRWGFIGDHPTVEGILQGEDREGLEFFGHMVIWLPTRRLVIDASLHTQGSKMLSGLGVTNSVVVGEFDHRKGHVGFWVQLGRGKATYRLYPKRDGWTRRRWPFGEIRELGREAGGRG